MGYDKNGRATLPSDDFGYVNYLVDQLDFIENLQRQSGRTTRTLNRLKDGDILVVPFRHYAKGLEKQLKEEGRNVRVVCIHPEDETFVEIKGQSGRIYFDHLWVYLRLKAGIKKLLWNPDIEIIRRGDDI